jgi:hypothetical protein
MKIVWLYADDSVILPCKNFEGWKSINTSEGEDLGVTVVQSVLEACDRRQAHESVEIFRLYPDI